MRFFQESHSVGSDRGKEEARLNASYIHPSQCHLIARNMLHGLPVVWESMPRKAALTAIRTDAQGHSQDGGPGIKTAWLWGGRRKEPRIQVVFKIFGWYFLRMMHPK